MKEKRIFSPLLNFRYFDPMNVDKFSCLYFLPFFLLKRYPVVWEKNRCTIVGSAGAPGAVPKHGRTFTTTGPNRGQGILTQPGSGRIPICGSCSCQIRLVMVINSCDCMCRLDLIFNFYPIVCCFDIKLKF